RFQDPLAGLRVDAAVGFARTGIEHLAGRIDGKGPDRQRCLAVRQGRPTRSRVATLPDAATRGADKDHGGVRGVDRQARHPPARPAVVAGWIAAALLIGNRRRAERGPRSAHHAISLWGGRSLDAGGRLGLGWVYPDGVMPNVWVHADPGVGGRRRRRISAGGY